MSLIETSATADQATAPPEAATALRGDPKEGRDLIASGLEAASQHAWRQAYELLKEADATERLSGAELEVFGDASYWSGHLDDALAVRERAYASYAKEGDEEKAAAVALTLAFDYWGKEVVPLFNGWFATAERLLKDKEKSPAHARLELAQGLKAMIMGELDEAMEHATRAYEMGEIFEDRDVEAVALVTQGRVLVMRGQLDEGLKMLDEAAASALAGALDPYSSCLIYCITITSCQNLGDYDRAKQWTDAAHRWSSREDVSGFPGACRIHRSEILRLGGDWDSAEQEATNACQELEAYDVYTTALGYYEIGEIRRRRGDFAAAEEAYRKAHELGRDPQPGLALLRLAQGKVDEAVHALRRSLDDGKDPLVRLKRLPAQVEVSLASGDVATASLALRELAELVDGFRVDGKRTPLFEGALELASGQVGLARQDLDSAEGCLRKALATWLRVGAPYEAATARMYLGRVYQERGDREGARSEWEAAKAAFDRLGAVLDASRARELLGEAGATKRTFLFSDIVDSTKLLDALGDQKWAKLLDRHDRILREAIEAKGGEVIKHTGDGFFAAFETPKDAVEAAAGIQKALQEEFISVRIGLHSGEALERGDDYAGRGVNVAARVGALAQAGEVLVSRETLDGVALSYSLSTPRSAELKGFEEPVDLVSLAWQ